MPRLGVHHKHGLVCDCSYESADESAGSDSYVDQRDRNCVVRIRAETRFGFLGVYPSRLWDGLSTCQNCCRSNYLSGQARCRYRFSDRLLDDGN